MNNEYMQTPYFVIDKYKIDSCLEKLKDALNTYWPNYIIGYSYKTNSLLWIIHQMKKLGCYAEVVSDDEYNLAKSIGTDKIIYNGIAKTKDTFLEAIRHNCIVNIDSENEISWLDELDEKTYGVGIRVNFDLESKCPGQTQCGEEGERFGFCYENGELKNAIDRIVAKGVKIVGLHLHKSSKTRMPDIYNAIAEMAVQISQEYKMDLDYIDIGGGFFGGLENKPQFSEYFQQISEILNQNFDYTRTTLIIEPGMALIGAAVDYITTVVDVKKTTKNNFIITDGSRTQIDPLMSKSNYFFEINKIDENREIIDKQIVSGFTCMEHDRIFILEHEDALLPGDKVIYHKVGAYTMCLTPLFIKWFPDVYVKTDNGLKLVRNKWEVNDYISRSAEI